MLGSLERRTTAALEVVELPPPTPSSWRGSSAPKAAVRMASRLPASSIKGSTSTPLNSQHLLVPPRIQVPRSVNTAWPAFRFESKESADFPNRESWKCLASPVLSETSVRHMRLEYNLGNLDEA